MFCCSDGGRAIAGERGTPVAVWMRSVSVIDLPDMPVGVAVTIATGAPPDGEVGAEGGGTEATTSAVAASCSAAAELVASASCLISTVGNCGASEGGGGVSADWIPPKDGGAGGGMLGDIGVGGIPCPVGVVM